MNMELVWTNTASETTFAAQTVALDLSDYDAVMVEMTHQKDSNQAFCFLCAIGKECNAWKASLSNVANFYWYNRQFSASETGVTFSANYTRARNNTSGVNATNSDMIPARIWGVKGIGSN